MAWELDPRLLSNRRPHLLTRFNELKTSEKRRSPQHRTFPPDIQKLAKSLRGLEARVRIELTRKGFADLSLSTWVPRRLAERMWCRVASITPHNSSRAAIWSGRRELNPRPSPWQGDALPLSYSRNYLMSISAAVPGGQRETGRSMG